MDKDINLGFTAQTILLERVDSWSARGLQFTLGTGQDEASNKVLAMSAR